MDDDRRLAELQDRLRNLRLETNTIIEQIEIEERRLQARRHQRRQDPNFVTGQSVRILNPSKPTALDSIGTILKVTSVYVHIITDRGKEIRRNPNNVEHLREDQ
jgi:hypothetical protein